MYAAGRERVPAHTSHRPAPVPSVSTETMRDDLAAFLEDARLFRDNGEHGLLVWCRCQIIRLEILLKGQQP